MLQKNKKINEKALLDSSAVIALLTKEQGYELLDDLLPTACISTVNLSEIVSVLARRNVDTIDIDNVIDGLIPEIIPFSEDIAIFAGKLIVQTQKFGLSLGDRACLATGITHNLTVYTTDQAWKSIEIDGLRVVVIR